MAYLTKIYKRLITGAWVRVHNIAKLVCFAYNRQTSAVPYPCKQMSRAHLMVPSVDTAACYLYVFTNWHQFLEEKVHGNNYKYYSYKRVCLKFASVRVCIRSSAFTFSNYPHHSKCKHLNHWQLSSNSANNWDIPAVMQHTNRPHQQVIIHTHLNVTIFG